MKGSDGHSTSKFRCKSLPVRLRRDELLALDSTLLQINHEEEDCTECSPVSIIQDVISTG